MRVLVCGGRDFTNRAFVHAEISRIGRERGPITCLIEGGQRGADAEAKLWARARMSRTRHPVEHLQFPADWKKFGRGAGPIRNAQMLADGKPDLVIAFPEGEGTANMVRLARKAGVEVVKIAPPSSEF